MSYFTFASGNVGIACIREDPVRGQCYRDRGLKGEGSVCWIKLALGAPLLGTSGSDS